MPTKGEHWTRSNLAGNLALCSDVEKTAENGTKTVAEFAGFVANRWKIHCRNPDWGYVLPPSPQFSGLLGKDRFMIKTRAFHENEARLMSMVPNELTVIE